MTNNICRILLIFGISVTVSLSQSFEDDVFHFTNPAQGNAVWIIDESSLPWTGGYHFLRSISGMHTTLLSVVDSSTGVTLGQCVAPQDFSGNQTKRWEKFEWQLSASGLDCNFETSTPNSNRVNFAAVTNPRTFSVRIQSVTGPACLRDLTVQNEQPVGCPPHLSRNSFTAIAFNCSCPYLDAANLDAENENEDVDMLANTPQFPLFKGIAPSGSPTTAWTLSPSPCAGHECANNGTCLVSQEGTATCLCRNGFTGDRCELDVCSSVPCQNGGVCRSNAGIAYCDCLPAFTGLLCESSNDEAPAMLPQCNPECANGQCVIKEGRPQCECRQGFTGANCNVLDVCLGDAACSMFGPNAKCVLDDDMDRTASATLMNGTYDCLCPHPIHGQFVECMQLHAPSSVSSAEPVIQPNGATPTLPIVDMAKFTTEEILSTTPRPTSFVPPFVITTDVHQQTQTPFPTQPETRPEQSPVGFTVTREPMRPVEITLTSTLPPPFSQHIITAEHTQPPFFTSQQPVVETAQPMATQMPIQTQTTFIFPQTPETTPTVQIGGADFTQPQHKFVSPNTPDHEEEETEEHETETTQSLNINQNKNNNSNNEEEEEEEEENVSPKVVENFPTPSTMHVVPTEITSPTTTATVFETSTEITHPSTTEMEEEEEDDDMTTEEVTETTTELPTTIRIEPSTMATDPPTTTTEEEETTTEESSEAAETEETTLTNLPFWMTSSTTRQTPPTPAQPSPTPMLIVPEVTETSTEEPIPEDESEEDQSTTTESNEVLVTKNMETTTASDVIHQHSSNGKQSSAAASWIIAIIALIVLGLLLLATSLFILRYIRQSRKLHGKYNPAREEHNLSAAYAMPMSHIAKEERLI